MLKLTALDPTPNLSLTYDKVPQPFWLKDLAENISLTFSLKFQQCTTCCHQLAVPSNVDHDVDDLVDVEVDVDDGEDVTVDVDVEVDVIPVGDQPITKITSELPRAILKKNKSSKYE